MEIISEFPVLHFSMHVGELLLTLWLCTR